MTPERKIAHLEVQLDLALNYLTSVCDKAETKEKCLLCGEKFEDGSDFGHPCPLPAARDFLKDPGAQANSVLLSLDITKASDISSAIALGRELNADEVRDVAEGSMALRRSFASLTPDEVEAMDESLLAGVRESVRKIEERAEPTEESTAEFMDELCAGEEEPDLPGHEPLKLGLTQETISDTAEDE